MSLVSLLIAILIVGLILYLIGLLPIDQPFKTIAYAIVILLLIIWLAQTFGVLGPVLR